MAFRAYDPNTGQFLYEVASLNADAREALVASTHLGQRAWRAMDMTRRSRFVAALSVELKTRREVMALALATEMGKPIVAARAEVDKCATLCDAAIAAAPRALAPQTVQSDSTATTRVLYEPLGVVLAIMPWNFPYWQALRFAIPALMAGNGVLIKPAPSVPGAARELEAALRAAAASSSTDAPCRVAHFSVEHLDGVIADPRIAGVTLTGSERAGRHVAGVAGLHLKKVVLELGGSDPFIVLASADVAHASEIAVAARMVNSGQSCIAAKRFIVVDDVYDEFLERFCSGVRALVVGDPRDERVQIGPLATQAARDNLALQVADSIALGARAVVGGAEQHDQGGFFFRPTVLVDVPATSPAATDELFGPVAAVIRVPDTDAAVVAANATRFGLGASLWSRNVEEQQRCIALLDCGMVFVNEMVVSDPRYPFGGVKHSGLGRELGDAGYREFTNIKTVRVNN